MRSVWSIIARERRLGTHLVAQGSVQAVLALALVAGLACPAAATHAGTVDGVAGAAVLAGAVERAVQPKLALRTGRQALRH